MRLVIHISVLFFISQDPFEHSEEVKQRVELRNSAHEGIELGGHAFYLACGFVHRVQNINIGLQVICLRAVDPIGRGRAGAR